MISRKSKKKPSNLHYRSARVSNDFNGKDRFFISSRCKWNLIKGVIFFSGLALIFGSLYLPFIDSPMEGDNKHEHSPMKVITGHLKQIKGAVGAAEHKVQEVIKKKVRGIVKHRKGDDSVNLGRGVSGLPMSQTPALIGAKRGHIECDVDVDQLAYWNMQGERDNEFKSPFMGGKVDGAKPKYIAFEPDRGGWNNIRMNLENMFILAAATGRTLVLPPPVPMYLLNQDKGEKHRGFGDFFPIHEKFFQDRIDVISMEEFLKREGGDQGQFPIPEQNRTKTMISATGCDKRKKSDISCNYILDFLEESADLMPQFNSSTCIIFDEDKFKSNDMSKANIDQVKQFCDPREINYYITPEFTDSKLIYIKSKKGYRVMAHFYGYLLFTNPSIFNYYKRFVRDFMHYNNEIYCAAGKIVLALQEDSIKRGFHLDSEKGGGYAALHVRRGDLQYKKVKISAEEWYDNLKETFKDNEVIYIATDERNKTFFDPIKEHTDVKFLDDYWDMAKLGDLDPNYMGMIDTIVASRGRVFGGTFRSTFTGYINRMRGYHGMSMKDSYYSFLEKKKVTHEWLETYSGTSFAFEWPDGWVGIDGDTNPSKDKF